MGGCLCFLVPIWVLLGLGIFLTVLVIYWSVLWVPTPLLLCLIGGYLLVFDAEAAALQVAREPDVWTDGSRVEDRLSTVSSSGAGFSSGHSSRFWAGRTWGHVDSDDQGIRLLLLVVGTVLFLALCRLFKGLSCGGLFLPCRLLVVFI